MSRSGLLLVAVALAAAGAIGCAHCDVCDDFPAPCTGPNCGGGFGPGGPMVAPMGPSYPVPAAPQPGPAAAPAQPGPAEANPAPAEVNPAPAPAENGIETPTTDLPDSPPASGGAMPETGPDLGNPTP